jgi:hypothetical protein
MQMQPTENIYKKKSSPHIEWLIVCKTITDKFWY